MYNESRLVYTEPSFSNSIKILLVDDCKVNQFMIGKLLSRWKVEYDISNNGYEAIQQVTAGYYDLIFLDIEMPGINGYETARKIRDMEGKYFKEIPILALSANLLSELRLNAFKNGINDFLGKPFSEEELIEKIQRLLPGSS